MKLSLSVIALIAAGTALAQTQVPHEFQAGESARAAEVNENFAALAAGVDTNSARTAAVVLDGNDNEIGQLVSIGENFWDFIAINDTGYVQSISFQDGRISGGTLVYASSDCSGQPYAIDTFGGQIKEYRDTFGNPALYYVDKNAVPITNFSSGSLSTDSGCFVQADNGRTVWPVSLNDPAITGVSSATYLLPIRIARPD